MVTDEADTREMEVTEQVSKLTLDLQTNLLNVQILALICQ